MEIKWFLIGTGFGYLSMVVAAVVIALVGGSARAATKDEPEVKGGGQ